jgi:hypothetical protein
MVASEYLEALTLELPERPGYRGDRIEDVSEVRGAVWQFGWPKLPKEVALAIRSREWGEKLKLWPPGETFEGDGEREFPRLQGILKALEHDVLRAHLPFAPEVWICPLDGSRSDYHKNLVMEAANMQAYIHHRWAPDTCVPLFCRRFAAGYPGLWNYSQPFTARGRRNEMIPSVTHAIPIRQMLLDFLDCRKKEDGSSLLSLFGTPIDHDAGWVEFPFCDFDQASLPTESFGPWKHRYGTQPEWVRYFHGCKVEAMYSILADCHLPGGGLSIK